MLILNKTLNKNSVTNNNLNSIFQIIYTYTKTTQNHYPLFYFLNLAMIFSISFGGTGSCLLYSSENSPCPDVNPLNSVAYPNIQDKGTSAFNTNISPLDSVFVTDPLLLAIPTIAY